MPEKTRLPWKQGRVPKIKPFFSQLFLSNLYILIKQRVSLSFDYSLLNVRLVSKNSPNKQLTLWQEVRNRWFLLKCFLVKKPQPKYFFLYITKLRAELCSDIKTSRYKTWAWKILGLRNRPFPGACHMLQIGLRTQQPLANEKFPWADLLTHKRLRIGYYRDSFFYV